jgi:hypothetical protein
MRRCRMAKGPAPGFEQQFAAAAWALLLAAVLPGCSTSDAGDSKLAAEGARFLLAEEPAGAMGILDFREEQPPGDDIALFGRIGGASPVWSNESAEFVISDPTHQAAADDHACHSDNCPFCKNKQEPNHSLAIVMLTGDDGRVPAASARRLLPLEEGQLVVVRGAAEVNAIGQLVVRARGVYIRQ